MWRGGGICESKNKSKNEGSRHTWCEGGVPVEVNGIVRELTERIFLCGIVGRRSCYGGGTGLEWLGMGGGDNVVYDKEIYTLEEI